MDLVGQNLGRYHVIEAIGAGGMATVYKAYQPALDRFVAIKVLPPQHASIVDFEERFLLEARAIAQLSHPNILPIYDVGLEKNISYFVMKYVPGLTLQDLMGLVMPLEKVSKFIDQVAGALDHAHKRGVLHRDIKPSNMLMDEGEWLLLADFGLAKVLEGQEALTATGTSMGTPTYVSPEQAEGLAVDHRTDIYSLGIILYEMVTGNVPYQGETPMSVLFKHVYEPLPPPTQFNPNLPPAVEAVVKKAAAKKPDERYQHAGELAAALRQAIVESGATAAASKGAQGHPQVISSAITQPLPSIAGRQPPGAEDGDQVPVPQADASLLAELAAPGGALKLRDQFYIEREADARLRAEVVKLGSTTTIRAPQQTGKSSLLVRGVQHARDNGAKIVSLDLQRVDEEHLASPDTFLRYLAELIVRKLRLDVAEVDAAWDSSLGPQDKLTYFMEDYVLPEAGAPIVLAMDEVDRLLHTPFSTDFFALIRSWHNNRAMDEIWDNLNLIMVISTEPYHLIADVNQSPFNVGLKLHLDDLDEADVQDLNQRHNSPVGADDFAGFMQLLGGQPYLCRRALYTMVTQRLTFAELERTATSDSGPFGDHLRRHLAELREDPASVAALAEVIRQNRCSNDDARFRLLRAGLVKVTGDRVVPRCDLYRRYFEGKL